MQRGMPTAKEQHIHRLDKSQFSAANRATNRTGRYLSPEEVKRYEDRLKKINHLLGISEDPDGQGHYFPKTTNRDALVQERRKIQKILIKKPGVVVGHERDIMIRKMQELERKIREHKPLSLNQMLPDPRKWHEVERLADIHEQKIKVINPLKKALKNLRVQLFPNDLNAGNLEYLLREK